MEANYNLYNVIFRNKGIISSSYAAISSTNQQNARSLLEKRLDEISEGSSSQIVKMDITDSTYKTHKEGVVFIVFGH